MDLNAHQISMALTLLDFIGDVAPSFPQDNVRELVISGETKVALENLCDNLFELGVQLPAPTRDALVEACRSASVNERYWGDFKVG